MWFASFFFSLFFGPFLCSSILKKGWCDLFVRRVCTWYEFCFLFLHTFLSWAEFLKELSCPLKGCWRISTSQRMQTNYASSPGKVKPLFWTSLKPSHQRLSWGVWRCRYFWRRMAGNCTWEPGCTGHFWAGFGWTLFLKVRGWRLPRRGAQKTRRDGAILYQINTRCAPDAEQHLISGSEIYPICLAHWRPWAEHWTAIWRNVLLLCHLFPPVI